MFFYSLTTVYTPLVSFPMGLVRGCHLDGRNVINLPALAIDKKPGPVCLSLLEPNEDAKNTVENRVSQVLVGEAITVDGLSTSTVTTS